MAKKWIATLLLVCILACLISGCTNKITAEEAAQIVLSELGTVKPEGEPHVHPSDYNGTTCYNVFVTIAGKSIVYIVSDTGKILGSAQSDHQH